MRIIVSTVNGGLEDRVNPAFGRTPTFTIVDVENGEITNAQVVQNPGYSQPRGAGVTASQFCIDQEADVVIAGHFGPNSSGVLQAAGIRIVSAPATMTVREAVEAFLRGELTQAVLNPEGGGAGRGMGRGGRGQGMSSGRSGGW
ncbi:dinitrogenase iron-molybdenum cofactor [Thermococcus sp. 18S1]|uniref:NifB/NifX family molybdenum-iron cluster-binding protein n=1 Tax=Thermococcus sp. 18S1 TaxID=1638210 RepID=UPI001438F011|nr:NifB/NifX family molybdenum-iron cluster-binding protein [Thermococcus sp. 18S1]NJE31435.1 dinitrogenase iron-molybdenum cofactor [Thermococcus sp. 18S1]